MKIKAGTTCAYCPASATIRTVGKGSLGDKASAPQEVVLTCSNPAHHDRALIAVRIRGIRESTLIEPNASVVQPSLFDLP